MREDIFKSVFSIREKEVEIEEGYCQPERHSGFAVAIAPRHLLTAHHCVERPVEKLLLLQPEQNIRIEEGFNVVDSDLEADLAIVEVPAELKFYKPVVTKQWRRPRSQIILANHFDGCPQIQPVSKCFSTLQDLDYKPRAHVRSYKMPVTVIGGYSGSPLFTDEGDVVSIVAERNKQRQDRVQELNKILTRFGFNPVGVPFEAADPKRVSRLVQGYNL